MRRRLYNLFGLPELPDAASVEDNEIELESVIEEGDPINIPKPVRKTVRQPVKDLKFHDLG
ncbi:MAG: hypothetical protein NZ802_02375, partial [Candidatus Poseidoniales archaeon]|nr:hypothetical protein [Candidatus Poseidoniales archaeon]